MGDWVLYAAAIIGAWSMAEAVMRLVDAVDKKERPPFGWHRKAVSSGESPLNENTIIVAERH